MTTFIQELINTGNGLLWGSVLIYLLLGAGLLFTIWSGFAQIRYFSHMWGLLKESRVGGKTGISSFQALSTSLAARVGTGNLAGVAIALTLGGPGAIFWMWVTAMLGMATSFVESTLAQAYKVPHGDNTFRGGPAYYIQRGLGQRWLAILFALCLIVAFGLAFNSVQANTIAQALNESFNLPKWMAGVGLVILTAPIIFGGLKSVAKVTEWVVPFMALAYLSLALIVVLMNLPQLPAVMSLIVKSAFGIEQAASGALAYTIAQALMNGVKRGLFSNEAGMGSAPNAAATAQTVPNHPATQGFIQMLGVFIDTLVICTATAAMILLSGVLGSNDSNGIHITQAAITAHIGSWGGAFVAIAVFFFAFTSIIANYSYGESNLEFIVGQEKARLPILLLRLSVLGMVMVGSIAQLGAVWDFADLSMGLMALINLIAILLLAPVAMRLLRDYEAQLKAGKVPTFNPDNFPKLKSEADRQSWDQTT